MVIKGSKDAVAAGLAKVKAFLGKIESKFIEVPGLLCWQNRRLEATVLAEASRLRGRRRSGAEPNPGRTASAPPAKHASRSDGGGSVSAK